MCKWRRSYIQVDSRKWPVAPRFIRLFSVSAAYKQRGMICPPPPPTHLLLQPTTSSQLTAATTVAATAQVHDDLIAQRTCLACTSSTGVALPAIPASWQES